MTSVMKGGSRPSVGELFGLRDGRTLTEDEYAPFGLADTPHQVGRASSSLTLERIRKTCERCPEAVIVSHEKMARAALGAFLGEGRSWMRHFEEEITPRAGVRDAQAHGGDGGRRLGRDEDHHPGAGPSDAAPCVQVRRACSKRPDARSVVGDAGLRNRRPLFVETKDRMGTARNGGPNGLPQGGD